MSLADRGHLSAYTSLSQISESNFLTKNVPENNQYES